MKVYKHEHVAPFDVDGTLVLPYEYPKHGIEPPIKVYDSVKKLHINMRAHKPMVRLLEEELHRGSLVVVWSRGGNEWASDVIKALGLDHHENLIVVTKPWVYFDDLAIDEWLKHRVYLEPDTIYKR